MNALNTVILFAVTYLAVFAAGYWNGFQAIFGARFDLLPALMVYCGLSANLATVTAEAILGGCLFDSLSANPMGITIVPLFVVGFIVHHQRELILRDQAYAQFILGAGASVVAPVLTVLLLMAGGHKPLVGWGSLWQLIVLALAGGCFTPFCFWFFDRLERMLNYQSISESSFRPDREIKRGRG
jgi:rod shape-determining protein MreD